MTIQLPDDYLDLFEKRVFVHLVALLPEGRPHVTVVRRKK